MKMPDKLPAQPIAPERLAAIRAQFDATKPGQWPWTGSRAQIIEDARAMIAALDAEREQAAYWKRQLEVEARCNLANQRARRVSEAELADLQEQLIACQAALKEAIHDARKNDEARLMAEVDNAAILHFLYETPIGDLLDLNRGIQKIKRAAHSGAALLARVQQMEVALKPFAEMARRFHSEYPDDTVIVEGWPYPVLGSAIFIDLKMLRAALEASTKEETKP
ncbi:MAG: hypothetical protein KGL39_05745 [Patescibacteria group bacterium]|nr:hypothetical protein [Patescibacteria group bacterium]